jgi:hypothetical protein
MSILSFFTEYGPAVIDHCLLGAGLPENVKIGKGFTVAEGLW